MENRPDREKIASVLNPLTKSYVLSYIHNLNQLETEIKRVEDCYLDQILALIPDIEECNQLCCDFIAEEAKKQERERIFTAMDKAGIPSQLNVFQKQLYKELGQALKENDGR